MMCALWVMRSTTDLARRGVAKDLGLLAEGEVGGDDVGYEGESVVAAGPREVRQPPLDLGLLARRTDL